MERRVHKWINTRGRSDNGDASISAAGIEPSSATGRASTSSNVAGRASSSSTGIASTIAALVETLPTLLVEATYIININIKICVSI